MRDRLQFHDRLRWQWIDLKGANPYLLTGLWLCPDYREGDSLSVHIGHSRLACAHRVKERRTDGVTVLRFFCSVKTRKGWKLLRFCRESTSGESRTITQRLIRMPGPYPTHAVRRYKRLIRSQEARLASITAPSSGPRISVLMPVFNPPLDYLLKAIESVRAQTYPRWELCIADDASTAPEVVPFLEKQAAADPRIKWIARAQNGHISKASNSALTLATGTWCALLDQDDELSPHAFAAFAQILQRHPDARLIYSDEDKIDEEGRRYGPYHKPDWMPELLLGQNFISHLGFYRTDRLRELGGFRSGHEGCQDWDLALRYTRDLQAGQIIHLPFILYHWRAIPGSTAQSTAAKPYVATAAWETLQAALSARMISARPTLYGFSQFRLEFIPPARPRVALVGLPSSVAPAFDAALAARLTDYEPLEFAPAAQPADSPLHALLEAAQHTTAEILVALPGGVAPGRRDWLLRLVGALGVSGVAAAGGNLVGPDGRIIDGCLMLDGNGRPRAAFFNRLETEHGYHGRAQLAHNPGGLSLNGIAVRRADLLSLGKLTPKEDLVDAQTAGWVLCARLRTAGRRVIHDPGVTLQTDDPLLFHPRPDPRRPPAHLKFPVTSDPSLHSEFRGQWPLAIPATGSTALVS